MRYTLPPRLAELGFVATPLSFYHPQFGIVVEYHKPGPRSLFFRPWVVTVDGSLVAKRNGRLRDVYSPRRYVDPIGAAEAGLRAAGVKVRASRPEGYHTGKPVRMIGQTRNRQTQRLLVPLRTK